MTFADGWAALNLDMPSRVPRTEYSAEAHWDLMTAVTGVPVSKDSSDECKNRARVIFRRAWNYDLHWSTLVNRKFLGEKRTSMGHAVYAAGGTDFNTDISCPFTTPEEVLAFDPWEECGTLDKKQMVQQFEDSYRHNAEARPDGVNMTGIYITCISGLIDLFGWDMLLLAAGAGPRQFGDLINRYCSWIGQHYEALAEADVPVVMVHDDMVWSSGPFMHPDWYRQFLFPNFRKFIAPLVASGKKVLFTADGDYSLFIDDIAACGVNGFVMEPSVDMQYVAERYGKTHAFIGNADTRVLLSGPKAAIRAEVERCMAIGKSCPGFFMAVGNHIPPNTPVDNAIYYNEVYVELSKR